MMIKGSADHKQHINLSAYAWSTIRHDMEALMRTESLSGFLNAVFQRYYEYADASITLALDNYRRNLKQTLSAAALDETSADKAISCLAQKKEQELCRKAHSYPAGNGLKFRLNNNNFAYLYPDIQPDEEQFHFPEDSYYHSAGQYLKAVIEEYCEKSYFERETIFLRNEITMFEQCIQSQTLVKITLDDGCYELRPYCITADLSCEYHYLIGYGAPLENRGKDEKPMSVRLLRILDQECKTYRSGKLSQNRKKELQHLLHEKGAAFLQTAEPAMDISVRLTPEGIQKYSRMVHLRPDLVSHEDHPDYSIYHFHCTLRQARFYLFRLGKDSYVLDPPELRKALRERFGEAYAAYAEETSAFDF